MVETGLKEKEKKKAKEYDSKEFAPCDLKLILLGDSAVGKSKFDPFSIRMAELNFKFQVGWALPFWWLWRKAVVYLCTYYVQA